jgi:hypothetical protein
MLIVENLVPNEDHSFNKSSNPDIFSKLSDKIIGLSKYKIAEIKAQKLREHPTKESGTVIIDLQGEDIVIGIYPNTTELQALVSKILAE